MKHKIVLLWLMLAQCPIMAQQWEVISQMPGSPSIHLISFADSMFGMVGGISGTRSIYLTQDGGITWDETFNFDSVTSYGGIALEVVSRTNAIFSCSPRKIYRFNGNSWHMVPLDIDGRVNDFYMFDQLNGFAAGYATGYTGFVLKTVDGGETWIQLPFHPEWGLDRIDGNGITHLKAIMAEAYPKKKIGGGKENSGSTIESSDPWFGYVYTSDDGGQNWFEELHPNYMPSEVAMTGDSSSFICGAHYPYGGFNHEGFVWECGHYFQEHEWNFWEEPDNDEFSDIEFSGPDYGIIVGNYGTIYRYYSHWWYEDAVPVTSNLYSLAMHTDTIRNGSEITRKVYAWVCGDSGIVLKRSEVVVGAGSQMAPCVRPIISPNPFNGPVRVTLPDGSSHGTLWIYDAGGRCIYTFQVSNPDTRGLDLSFLRPGMYVAKLVTDQVNLSQKLVRME